MPDGKNKFNVPVSCISDFNSLKPKYGKKYNVSFNGISGLAQVLILRGKL